MTFIDLILESFINKIFAENQIDYSKLLFGVKSRFIINER